MTYAVPPVVPAADPDDDFYVLLTIDEWFARADDLCLDYGTEDMEGDHVVRGWASWSADTEFGDAELTYDRGVWTGIPGHERVAAYLQGLWDTRPREGDEAALLAAMLAESEPSDEGSTARPRRMADAIAMGLGIPAERMCHIVGRWSFWNYGVSMRTGWFESKCRDVDPMMDARAHLRKLTQAR